MGPDWYRSVGVDSNTNLNDFVPSENFCNTVSYTQKWYLKPRKKNKKDKKEKWKIKKWIFSKKEKVIPHKDASTITIDIENNIIQGKCFINCGETVDISKEHLDKDRKEFLNEATCAKCSCCKEKIDKPKQHKKQQHFDHNDDKLAKKQCSCNNKHKVHEIFRRTKAMDSSAKESIASSIHNNSIDDLTNSISLSDLCDQKNCKCETKKKPKTDKPTVNASASFEALAAETGNATIKLHLMNDRDQTTLTNNLTSPIVNAIREFVTNNNHQQEMFHEIKKVQNLVINHSQKLDSISDRLQHIEGTLKPYSQAGKHKSNRKPSTLEQLSVDINNPAIEETETKSLKPNDGPVKLSPVQSADEESASELIGDQELSNHMTAVRPASQKAPSRFCWTGAIGNK